MSLLLTAPAASGQALEPTDDPLPGSDFQGADGNQDDAAPPLDWVDWEALPAGSVVHNDDPNEDDSAFTNSKEDEPGEWDLTTEPDGVNPPKDNIRDAWSSVSQSGSATGSNTFLYLGFTREAGNGRRFSRSS